MEFAKCRQHAIALAVIAAFDLTSAASKPQSLPIKLSSETGQASSASSPGASEPISREVVPQDARELLLAAARVNGLDAPGLKPWHILVSYDKFDEDGDNVDSGTYEEF
jgi:hypothetical protein